METIFFIMINGRPGEPLIPYVIGTENLDVVIATFSSEADAKTAAEMNSFAVNQGYEIFGIESEFQPLPGRSPGIN